MTWNSSLAICLLGALICHAEPEARAAEQPPTPSRTQIKLLIPFGPA